MVCSGCYYHLNSLEIVDRYTNEKELIKLVPQYKGRYVYRCMTADMHNYSFMLNNRTIQKIMDELELNTQGYY